MRYLVQIDLKQAEAIKGQLKTLGVPVLRQTFDYLTVDIPGGLEDRVRALPGVVSIHPEARYGALELLIPVDKKLAEFQRIFLSNPLTGPFQAFKFIYEADQGKERVPTSVSRKAVGADVADALDITGKGIKVAVLDSTPGYTPVVIRRAGRVSVVPIEEAVSFATAVITPRGEEVVFSSDLYIYRQAKRKWAKVKAVIRHLYEGDVVSVVARGGLVHVTPNHSLVGLSGNPIRASQLRRGKKIHVNRLDPNWGTDDSKYTHDEKGWFFQGTEEVAWLYGFFAAEGTAMPKGRGCYIALVNKDPTYILKADAILRDNFNVGTTVAVSQDGMWCVRAFSSDLRRLFLSKFYTERADKKVPEEIFNAPKQIKRAFLKGYWAGDGNIDVKERWRFGSKSQTLACGILWLVAETEGFDFTIQAYPKFTHVTFNRSRSEEGVEQTAEGNVIVKVKTERDVKLSRKEVLKTLTFPYKGFVYDLETDDHLFTAGVGGVLLHNTGTDHLGVQGPYLGGKSTMEGQPLPIDEVGHGYHVATTISGRPFQSIRGLLQGVAVDAEVMAEKVLGGGLGFGSTTGILRGMADAVEWGCDIISMSLGGEEEDPGNPTDRIISALTKEGIIVIVAAGNSGPAASTCGTPGASPDSLTVGAVDMEGTITSFSSRGPSKAGLVKPDLVAPGVNILSSTTGYIAVMQTADGPKLGAISGTSMSTPHVSGVVALAMQYARSKGKVLTTEGIKRAMSMYGQYPGGSKRNDYGYGAIHFSILKRYIDSLP